MSWFSRIGCTALALLALSGLTGCGFRPLYGTSSGDPRVTRELASVHVSPIEDRTGQLLHDNLVEQLSPKGEPDDSNFVLKITLQMSESKVALQKDNAATHNNVTYIAVYSLYQHGAMITEGMVSRTLSYDYILEHYADISAAEDVRVRATQIIAREIRDELAAYFIRRHGALEKSKAGPAGP